MLATKKLLNRVWAATELQGFWTRAYSRQDLCPLHLVPREYRRKRVPLLVLHHGLGEAKSARLNTLGCSLQVGWDAEREEAARGLARALAALEAQKEETERAVTATKAGVEEQNKLRAAAEKLRADFRKEVYHPFLNMCVLTLLSKTSS